jgi:hypothetical protein
MDLFYSLWTMMIGSFIIQFIVMSLIMTDVVGNITFSTGKFYISVIMALLMGLLEVGMHDFQMQHMHHISLPYYLSLGFALAVFGYLYRNQMYITDKEYLNEMIEHHSMALLTSEPILEKTQSERVRKLATNIVSTQEAEIKYMKQLINETV